MEKKPSIVFLDHEVIDRGDIDWSKLEALGKLTIYPRTLNNEQAIRRLREAGATAVLIDEYPIGREIMEAVPTLTFIGPAATGYNHIDLDCAKERGIAVCNVPAYSTEAVAQHTFALLLALTNQIGGFDGDIHAGLWVKAPECGASGQSDSECGESGRNESGDGASGNGPAKGYEPRPLLLLEGKSLGIVGYGNIGRKVAEIGRAFGMRINVFSQDPEAAIRSDVVSLHCPLTEDTRGMVSEEFIAGMKDGAVLINTARGGLLDEAAVAEALRSGKLAGLGADVLSSEPPEPDNPLLTAPRCVLTPHIAFTPVEIRQRVIDICADNLESFLRGGELNRIV